MTRDTGGNERSGAGAGDHQSLKMEASEAGELAAFELAAFVKFSNFETYRALASSARIDPSPPGRFRSFGSALIS